MKFIVNLIIPVIVLCFSGTNAIAQQSAGIQFENLPDWGSVAAKAKAENKYIFVDCWATWCGPCKSMDENVYALDSIGKFMNNRFVTLKVQMDSTAGDNSQTRLWYAVAKKIAKDYQIQSLPTFLFFSSDGKLVHKAMGAIDPGSFLQLGRNAVNPNKQYYTLLEKYQSGRKDYSQIPLLAELAAGLNERNIENKIAKDYIQNYLPTLSDEKILTRENLVFAATHLDMISSSDKIFKLIYNQPTKAEGIVNHPLFKSAEFVRRVIIREEIDDKLWSDIKKRVVYTENPAWDTIRSAIRQKYTKQNADSLVTQAMFNFYKLRENWNAVVGLMEQQLNKYQPQPNGKQLSIAIGGFALAGPGNDAWALNDIAWGVFKGTGDKKLLRKALSYSELSIEIEPSKTPDIHQYYDTKANLLYKLGRTKDAIKAETATINILKKNATDEKQMEYFVAEYEKVIGKMKKGIPTWSKPTN